MRYNKASLYVEPKKDKEPTKPTVCSVCNKSVSDETRLRPFSWHKKCLKEDTSVVVKCLNCSQLPHLIPKSVCPSPLVCERLHHKHLKEGEKCNHCEVTKEFNYENTPLPLGTIPNQCPRCGGKVIISNTATKKWVTYITPTGGKIKMRRER